MVVLGIDSPAIQLSTGDTMTKSQAHVAGWATFKSFTVFLKWVGYGPGNPCPLFWENGYLAYRVSLEGGKEAAIASARKTWAPHEADVVNVIETGGSK